MEISRIKINRCFDGKYIIQYSLYMLQMPWLKSSQL